jgi:hypothetical protein
MPETGDMTEALDGMLDKLKDRLPDVLFDHMASLLDD